MRGHHGIERVAAAFEDIGGHTDRPFVSRCNDARVLFHLILNTLMIPLFHRFRRPNQVPSGMQCRHDTTIFRKMATGLEIRV